MSKIDTDIKSLQYSNTGGLIIRPKLCKLDFSLFMSQANGMLQDGSAITQ